MSEPIVPNQSFLLKAMQYKVAACLSALCHVHGGYNSWMPGVWGNPNLVVWSPSGWRKDKQEFSFKPASGYAYVGGVTFKSARFDPGASNLQYGKKLIAQNVEATDEAKTKIVRNDTDGEIHVNYEEATDLTNSFSSSVTKGVTLDVSVDSTQKISGGYAGVSAEVSLSEHFGVSKSQEQTKEESEEGTVSESLAIDFEASPRSYYMVTITKEHEKTQQPFDINGIMDFDITLEIVGSKSQNVSVEGIAGLLQLINGYDTNHPDFNQSLDRYVSRVKNGINWITNPENRRIQISGINYATLEKNADYRVELLGGAVPPNLSHLPVVNAEDI